MREMISTAALLLLLGVAPQNSYAQEPSAQKEKAQQQKQKPGAAASIEVMAGHTSTTLDTKLLLPLVDTLKLFNRNLVNAAYEKQQNQALSSTHVVQLRYGIPKTNGLNIVVEANLGTGFDPRAQGGLLYATRFAQGRGVFLTTAQAALKKDSHLFSLTDISYSQPLTDYLNLVLGFENRTVVNGDGHAKSVQSPRIGLGFSNVQAGIGCNFTQKGNDLTIDGASKYDCGGYAKIAFNLK